VTLTLLLVFLDHGEPLLCIILQLLKDTIWRKHSDLPTRKEILLHSSAYPIQPLWQHSSQNSFTGISCPFTTQPGPCSVGHLHWTTEEGLWRKTLLTLWRDESWGVLIGANTEPHFLFHMNWNGWFITGINSSVVLAVMWR
jgi:hypothetical protein